MLILSDKRGEQNEVKGLGKFFLAAAIFFIFAWHEAQAKELEILVKKAINGEVITLEEGEYQGPLIIDKPVTIVGKGNVAIRSSDEATVKIMTDGATLKNIRIVHEAIELTSAAIYMEGEKNKLLELDIETKGMGIVLNNANDNILKDIAIVGPYKTLTYQASMDSREGNAVDLFRSHRNQLKNIQIEYAQDGIYLESSEENEISQCRVRRSRYGFHLMFTTKTRLEKNLSSENITGMMVMGTDGTVIKNNRLEKMHGHVYSQGLMLYDVKNARVERNIIERNLIGILVEDSYSNVMKNNAILANYIGIQFSRAKENEFFENDVIGNVIPAYGTSSKENTLKKNFWEGHSFIDFNGDEKNDWPYYANPVFLLLVTKKPAYQIFADSPGIYFMNMLLELDKSELLKDGEVSKMPHVIAATEKNSKTWITFLTYLFLAIITMIFMYLGGRRK